MVSISGGYDYEFVDSPPDSLGCLICLKTLCDPHITSCCSNLFCQVCISKIQDSQEPCPLCEEKKFTTLLHSAVTRQISALRVYCPDKRKGCDWQGELGQVEQHRSEDGTCLFTIVKCRYKQCRRRFEKRNTATHEFEECPHRPGKVKIEYLTKKFETQASKYQVELGALKAEIEVLKEERQTEIHHMKYEALVEIESIKKEAQAEIQAIKEESDKRIQYVQAEIQGIVEKQDGIKDIKRMYCEELEALKSQYHTELQALREGNQAEMQVMKDELFQMRVANEREQRVLKATCKDLQAKVASLQLFPPVPMPPFYYPIIQFKFCKDNNLVLRSPPLYSQPGGYKMELQIYPNGDSDAKNNHLSLYVCVIRGEFDSQLQWPFKGKVEVQMYNFSSKDWNCTRVINFEENPVLRKLDRYSMGIWGYRKFIHKDILRRDYLSSNVVQFKVNNVA